MQSNQRTELVKVYPILEWFFGGTGLIFWLFLAFLELFGRQVSLATFLLCISMLPLFILLRSSVLEINEHIIVTTTLLTRRQIGWDEIESIQVMPLFRGIILYGKSSVPNPKILAIPSQNLWFGKKKQIKKIFAQQIKLRQISVTKTGVGKSPGFSSASTLTKGDSDAPEMYVAAPPLYNSNPNIKPTNINDDDRINADALKPIEYRSPREIELEKKLNKPEIGVHLLTGAIGGSVAALISVIIWAAIAFVTHYEFSFVAVGVGAFVGFTARTLASKGTAILGLISAGISVMACVLGGILGLIAILAHGNPVLVADVFVKLLTHPDLFFRVYSEMLGPLDMVFYFVAIVAAYRMAVK